MIIRDLNHGDAPQAASFYSAALTADKDDFLDPFGASEIAEFCAADYYSLGAFKGTNLLGLILVTPFDCKNLNLFSSTPSCLSKQERYIHIRCLVVAIQRRSSIIAYRLIEQLVEFASGLGLGIVGEFDAHNHAAKRLYFNLGGRPLLQENGHILAARPPMTLP